MSKKLPIVAIVGRANVGKSSLYNAVLRRREAIIATEAGTTRDSIMTKATFQGYQFWLIDTAGLKNPEDDFEFTIQEQIIQASDIADIIWVIIEAKVMITEEDRLIVRMALKSKKPVFLITNKIDQAKGENVLLKFERLGVKPIIATSAINHQGISQLLEELIKVIPKVEQKESKNKISVSLIGRPNVGKSSLFNTLASKQQAIVAEKAGTTRDINRTTIRVNGLDIELMDTAGIRRSGKIERGVERFSVIRALSAIEQSDICLMVMEANELNVQLDQKIAGIVKDAGKGLILVVSKWDITENRTAFSHDEIAAKLAMSFDFVPWAPLIFTSSVTGQNVSKIFELLTEVNQERKKRLKTSALNQWLQQAIDAHPPAGLKNHNPKLNYIIQEDDNSTPAFKIFGSQTKSLHWSYRRYLERSLREKFGFEGTSVQLWFIEKHVAHKHGRSPTYNPLKTARKNVQ